jgi:hypothetical protein
MPALQNQLELRVMNLAFLSLSVSDLMGGLLLVFAVMLCIAPRRAIYWGGLTGTLVGGFIALTIYSSQGRTGENVSLGFMIVGLLAGCVVESFRWYRDQRKHGGIGGDPSRIPEPDEDVVGKFQPSLPPDPRDPSEEKSCQEKEEKEGHPEIRSSVE